MGNERLTDGTFSGPAVIQVVVGADATGGGENNHSSISNFQNKRLCLNEGDPWSNSTLPCWGIIVYCKL
eukprot:scaffold4910_cov169-Amphora_coffeaeformis.AAC.15